MLVSLSRDFLTARVLLSCKTISLQLQDANGENVLFFALRNKEEENSYQIISSILSKSPELVNNWNKLGSIQESPWQQPPPSCPQERFIQNCITAIEKLGRSQLQVLLRRYACSYHRQYSFALDHAHVLEVPRENERPDFVTAELSSGPKHPQLQRGKFFQCCQADWVRLEKISELVYEWVESSWVAHCLRKWDKLCDKGRKLLPFRRRRSHLKFGGRTPALQPRTPLSGDGHFFGIVWGQAVWGLGGYREYL